MICHAVSVPVDLFDIRPYQCGQRFCLRGSYGALYGAGIPSVLEPLGVDLGENTRPDGFTIVPYKNVKSQTWDCTCVNAFVK